MGKLSSRREKFATNSLSRISQKFLAHEWKLVNCFDYTFLNKWLKQYDIHQRSSAKYIIYFMEMQPSLPDISWHSFPCI